MFLFHFGTENTQDFNFQKQALPLSYTQYESGLKLKQVILW